ncbi:tetraspanin-10 [Falco rusticolus]|uniref:tetraspanin-10 n=1 Tax=Falco rusticolus TaxID=120794 RepID=UPI0018867120|nr:tetraspanin-10 [Falco rusticolus]XP_055556319.1 tetraspanin-10 [Falco cherrug]XP_055653379.1 tetraspanin-10 [Falco peregrinus]
MAWSAAWLLRPRGGESAHLLPQGSRLVRLPSSSSDEDDHSPAGDTDLAAGEQDPALWCSGPPKLSPFSQCVRYLAFLWNLLFLLLGLLALAVGAWGLLAKGSLEGERLAPLGSDPMLLFVLVGLGASTVSLAGCLGALRSSPCLLRFFVGAVLTFAALEVLGGLLLVAARHRLRDAMRDTLLLCLLRYQEEPDLRFLVDEVQRSLRCCGLSSYRDWETNPYFNCSAPGVQACSVPASCCLDPWQNGTLANTQCAFGVLRLGDMAASTIVHLGGCVAQLSAWLHTQAGGIVAGAAVLVLVEATGVLMALRVLGDIMPIGAHG